MPANRSKASCQGCKKSWPGQILTHCAHCGITICLMCQCRPSPEVNTLCSCFTHLNNSNVPHWSRNEIRPSALSQAVTIPFTRLQQQIWLHERPELDVYKLLIDSFRLRMHDEYLLDGVITHGSVYGGSMDSSSAFAAYLDAAELRPFLIPSWWNMAKRRECVALAIKPLHFHDLRVRLSQAMVVGHYGDSSMPAQLRVFGEAVVMRPFLCGTSPCNILNMMVAEEAKYGGVTKMNWFAWNTSFTETRWGRRFGN